MALSSDILQHIKQLDLQTRRYIHGLATGDFMSHTRGSGFEFDQLRDYEFGDDVRFIDWKSSARLQKTCVRQYKEDRNRNVIIIVDSSASTSYSSTRLTKYETIRDIAAMLALAAHHNKDSIGLIKTHSMMPTIIKERQGTQHLMHIMNVLFTPNNTHHTGSIGNSLKTLLSKSTKKSLVIIISDFIDQDCKTIINYCDQRHDVVALRVLDPLETEFSIFAGLTLQDSETGETISLHNRSQQKNLTSFITDWRNQTNTSFKKRSLDYKDIMVGKPFAKDVITFFTTRCRK